MNISNCGYNYRHHENFKIERPNGSGDCVLLVVRSPAQFVFGGEMHVTFGNSVVIFREGTAQIYGAIGEEYVNDWVHFEATDLEISELEKRGIVFDKILELSNVLPLSNLVQNIFCEFYSNNKHSSNSAHLYFELLMNKIADMSENAQKNLNPELFNKLSNLRTNIYSAPQNEWRIPDIARKLAMSESYLQHQYKNFFGRSIKNDVAASRIIYSKYLLFSTNYTVSVISQMCGYQNDVHFMRCFKESVKMTPTAYRNYAIYNKDKINKDKNPYCL